MNTADKLREYCERILPGARGDLSKWLRFIGVECGVLALVLALPFAYIMPYWVGHENGPVEMLQNIVIILGIIIVVREFIFTESAEAKRTWLTVTGVLLLCLGRELSWGRVFFFMGYDTSGGPVFLDMKCLPGHTLIYFLIAALMIATIYGLLRFVPWRRIFIEHRQWPIAQIVMLIVFTALAQMSEHTHDESIMASETAEEIFELWVYILFIGIVYELRWLFNSGNTAPRRLK